MDRIIVGRVGAAGRRIAGDRRRRDADVRIVGEVAGDRIADTGALDLGIDPRERGRICGTLELALPQRPLDGVAGQAGRADHERKRRGGND